MPEQEKQRMPGQWTDAELDSQAMETGQGEQAADNGAAQISPLIVIPPVAIAAVMGLLLAMVYGVTKEPIAESKRLDKQQKLSQVMPAFDNDPLTTENELSDTVKAYAGLSGEELTGFGITSSVNTGYSGYFSIVFGLTKDNTVERVRVLESFETPGLGSKAAIPPFIDQFDGKPLDFSFSVGKDGGDIDAITGATITSRAVCAALSQGIAAFNGAGGAEALVPELPEMTSEGQVVNPLEQPIAEDEAEYDPLEHREPLADPDWNDPYQTEEDGTQPPAEAGATDEPGDDTAEPSEETEPPAEEGKDGS